METNISYHDLKLMKCEDIKELLSKETVLAISQDFFNKNPQNSGEILSLWLNILSRSYFAANDLDLELEFLRKLLINLISRSFVDEQQTASFAEYRIYLNNAKEFLKWSENLFKGSEEDVLTKWMMFFLKNELEFFDFYEKKKNENNDELKELVTLIISQHELILEIIDGSLNHLNKNYTSQLDCKLTKSILVLCRFGQHVHPLSFKCYSQSWKVITNLSVHYLKYGNYTARPNWYFSTTALLLNGAAYHINTLYQSQSRKDPNDMIQKYMLFVSFSLRLFNKIAEANFSFVAKKFIEIIHKILINTYCMPYRLKNPAIPKLLVATGLLANLLKSLQLVCQDPHYHELLLKNASNTEIEPGLFKLIIDTLRAGIETDKIMLKDCSQFYGELFKLFFKDTIWFTKSDEYNKLVVLFSALIVKDETGCFKNYLRTQVISEHLPYSHTSAEILLIASRIFPEAISRDETLKEYRFWLQTNNAYRIDSVEISQLQVQRMLRNSFEVCRSSQFNFSDKELMLNQDVDISRDFRQLQCIGWKHVSAHKFLNIIEGALTKVDTAGISVKDFKEMVACLRLFEDNSNVLFQGGKVMVKLISFCQIILGEMNDDNINYYIMFMNAFFALFLKSSNNTRLHVLSQLAKHRKQLLKFTSWYLLKFFHECSLVPNEWRNVAKQFINDVNISDSGPKMCKLLFEEEADQIQNSKRQLPPASASSSTPPPPPPPGKRLRLMEPETKSFKEMITGIDTQINSFSSAKQNLDDHDMKLLRNVIEKLNNIATNSIKNV